MTSPHGIAALMLLASLAAPPTAEGACQPLEEQRSTNYIIPGVREFVFARPAGGTSLALDVFTQPGQEIPPTVVVIHGGGWTSGSREAHIGQLLELLTQSGYSWVSVDYRLNGPARIDEAVADVAAAIEFVRCHATRLRLDPQRLALLGEDAGAEIARRVPATVPVTAAVLIGGTYDEPLASPVRVASRLVHGGADSEVPAARARAVCDATRAAAVADERSTAPRCDLDLIDGASHRSENWWPSQWGYKARMTAWLREVLGAGVARPLDLGPQPLRDVLGAGLHKRLVFSPRRDLTLDAWIPPGAGPHVPVMLVHGGGWEAGDRVTYITPLFRPLAEAGLAWFSIDYGLTPDVTHEQQEQDVREAIAFVRDRAGGLNVDARKLVIVGESASGEMVARVGTEDRELAGVISFYGVYDFVPLAKTLTSRSAVTRLFGITTLDDRARATLDAHGPLSRLHRDQPPFLLIHGTAEGLWSQGLSMAARLATVGARHQLLRLEGAPHGMENWEGQPQWLHYKQVVVDWIRRVTR
jgi:acetyl esterase